MAFSLMTFVVPVASVATGAAVAVATTYSLVASQTAPPAESPVDSTAVVEIEYGATD